MATVDVPQPESDLTGAIADHVAAYDSHSEYQQEVEKGVADGYASLDAYGTVPITELPTGTTASTVSLGDHTHGDVASLYTADSVLAATDDSTPAPVTVLEQTLLGRVTGGDIAALTAAEVTSITSAVPKHSDLATGESNIPRTGITAANTLTSGVLYLSYLTAQKTELVGRVRVVCATGAAATPTLCQVGLFSVGAGDDLDADLTLLAASVSDTALLSASNTAYTVTFPSWVAKTAGQRYAVGVLVMSGAAMPVLAGLPLSTLASVEASVPPILSAELSGQTDISGNVTATLSASTNLHYVVVLPPITISATAASTTVTADAVMDVVKSIDASLEVVAAVTEENGNSVTQSFTAEQTVTASMVGSPENAVSDITASITINPRRYAEVP